MRRVAWLAACPSLFLLCECTRSIAASNEQMLPRATSSSSGEDSSDSENERAHNPFPFEQFANMFNKLATEVGLPAGGNDKHFHRALEELFGGLSDDSETRGKQPPQVRKGLLQKMLKAKMERQAAGQKFDMEAFLKDLFSVMGKLKDYSPDVQASPASALQSLARLTNTFVSPEDTGELRRHLENTAKHFKEFLPVFTDDEL